MAKINKITIPFCKYSIDSFQIRIPIVLIDSIIDKDSAGDREYHKLYSDTGEYTQETFKDKSQRISENGITTRLSVTRKKDSSTSANDYLTIGVNSKKLGSRYFEGITLENIHIVYDYIMKLNIAKFSFDSFISSSITDIDFKADYKFYGDKERFKEFLKFMESRTRDSKKSRSGCNPFTKNDNNLGIEWGIREKATQGSPFWKIYHKEIELLYNSDDFYKEYLKEIDINRVIRVEAQIKNKKTYQSYFGKDKACVLDEALRLNQKEWRSAMLKIQSKHIDKLIRQIRTPGTLKLTDANYYKLITMLMDLDVSYNSIIAVLQDGKTKQERYKIKQRFDKIYKGHIEKSDKNIELINRDEFLEEIGVK